MLRNWFLLSLLCLSFQLTWSQNLSGGIAIGLNGSQVDGDADLGFRKAGLSLGGYVQYELKPKLNLRPEIRFEQLGSRSRFDLIVGTGYFSFPVLLEYELPFNFGGDKTINLLGGPVFGVLLYGRDLSGDRTADLSRVDFRFLGGISFPFSDRWSGDFRLGYSLASFVSTTSSLASSFQQGRWAGAFHRYLTLSLYYSL
ncbi:MAG: outer membrane beta-barrel protein [Bacteroidota bacterium]